VKRFGNKVNLRKLEEIVMELDSVHTCVAFWDAENHKLYLCLSTIKNKAEFSKLQNDVMTHVKILPAIYKPDKIIIVEYFDFTTSGKVCLASLKRVCRSFDKEVINADSLYVNADKIFEELWNQYIKCKNIGFLMSGGTSIIAIQISNAVTEIFNMEFPELIGMLLKDVTFDECVNYIRNILINRVCSNDVSHCIDVSLNEKILNPKKIIIKSSSLNDFSTSNIKNYCQWYKCRGKTYDTSKQKENTEYPLKNISNIEILANYNLHKCVDASPTLYHYSE